MRRCVVLLCGCLTLGCVAGGAAPQVNARTAPAVQAEVWIFVSTDCPISNAYAPELHRIIEAYRPRGIRFRAIYADGDVDDATARAHAREYGLDCAVATDPTQRLVAQAGATHTPEVAVWTGNGALAYLGRIDDTWARYQRRRPAPTGRDLRDALEAVLAGRPAAHPRTAPVGCPIPEPGD